MRYILDQNEIEAPWELDSNADQWFSQTVAKIEQEGVDWGLDHIDDTMGIIQVHGFKALDAVHSQHNLAIAKNCAERMDFLDQVIEILKKREG